MKVFVSIAFNALLLSLFAFGPAAAVPVTPPPAAVCTTPTVPTTPGDVPAFPGRWWNPQRSGIGWDFFYGDGQQSMYLTWFTYDMAGRPVWLHGEVADLQFNAVTGETTWASTLHWVTWNPSGTRNTSPVGSVAVTFPYQTTTKAAVRWTWNSGADQVGPGTYDECLNDRLSPDVSQNQPVPFLNQAYSANWFYNTDNTQDPLVGWGVDLLIDWIAQTQYRETATAGIFDLNRRPVWMQSVDNWMSQPLGSTFNNSATGKLRYIRHKPFAPAAHPAITNCSSAATCLDVIDSSTVKDAIPSIFQREMDSASRGKMKLRAWVPASITGIGAIDWPPTAANMGQTTPFPDPIPVARVDANHIVVDKSICRIPEPQTTCNVMVAWVSEDPNAVIERLDLNTIAAGGEPVVSMLSSGAPNGQDPQELHIGDRFQYRISYRNAFGQDVKLRTPEVRAVKDGDIADAILDPTACIRTAQTPGCDLEPHNAGVGAIAGQAGVDGGAATYSIPIEIPPGRNGMQPSIALNYNSRSGNGIAGMGWSISGGSSIHRCPRTVAQDTNAVSVQMDSTDALCLDGQRLMLRAGTYGASGAQYRTEIDSFARITQVGASLAGDACFRVEQKSGRVAHYGALATGTSCGIARNARAKTFGSAATMSWLVDQIDDPVGNNMIFKYEDVKDGNNSHGEMLLREVRYTGKSNAEGTRSVVFNYEVRPAGSNDFSSGYLAGWRTLQTRRLTSIATCIPDASGVIGAQDGCIGPSQDQVRRYKLNYADSNVAISLHSSRSLLRTIEECALNRGAAVCKPKSQFAWSDLPIDHKFHELDLAGLPTPASIPGRSPRQITTIGDLDGDGSREILVTQQQWDTPTVASLHSHLVKVGADRQSLGQTEISLLGDDPVDFHAANQADIDGDGRADLLAPYTSLTTLRLYVWNSTLGRNVAGTSDAILFREVDTNLPWQSRNGGDPDTVAAVADFDGDGYVDILVNKVGSNCGRSGLAPQGAEGDNRTLCLFKNLSRTPITQSQTPYLFATGIPVLPTYSRFDRHMGEVAEINGDGIPDILVNRIRERQVYDPNTNQNVDIHFSEFGGALLSKRPLAASLSGCNTASSNLFQDCPAAALNIAVAPGQPNQLPAKGTFESPGSVPFWVDLNGDGLTDILYASTDPCKGLEVELAAMWCVQIATGKGYTAPTQISGGMDALALRPNSGGREFTHAARLSAHDADSDGRPDILFPAALAARICRSALVSYSVMGTGDDCTFPGAASPDPERNSQCKSLPGTAGQGFEGGCQAKVMVCADDPAGRYPLPDPIGDHAAVCGTDTYKRTVLKGIGGLFDKTAYKLKALRFQQNAAGDFSAVVVNLDLSGSNAGPSHAVIADPTSGRNSSNDLYGDGLSDLVGTIGCLNRVTATDLNACYAITGSFGPAALPDGRLVSSLVAEGTGTNIGPKLYISENVGAYERVGSAPELPDLMMLVTNGLNFQSAWSYYPLSSAGYRSPSDIAPLPLYEPANPASPEAYSDARHFYFTSSMPVVEHLYQRNGIGPIGGMFSGQSWKYGYSEAMYNHLGRGFQGFRKVIQQTALGAADAGRILRTITTFHQKFPLTGKIASVRTGVPVRPVVGPDDVNPIKTEFFDWSCNISNVSEPCNTAAANGTGPVNFPYLFRQVTTSYDLAAAELGISTQVAQTTVRNSKADTGVAGWDAFGNLTYSNTQSTDDFVTSRESSTENKYYTAAQGYGWVDLIEKSVQTTAAVVYASTHAFPAVTGYTPAQQIVTTKYTWNADRTPDMVEVQPESLGVIDAGQNSRTSFTYPSPSFGLPSQVSIEAQATDYDAPQIRTKRNTSFTYDGEGYFIASSTSSGVGISPLTTYTTFRARDGQLATSIDPKLISLTNEYDPFGRLISSAQTGFGGIVVAQPVKTAWAACTAGSCAGVGEGGQNKLGANAERYAAYRVTTAQNGSPTQVTWYDMLGRPIKSASRGFDGSFIASVTDYDSLGTVTAQSIPFLLVNSTSKPLYGTTFTNYDRLGRARRKTSPGADFAIWNNDVVTDYAYAGSRTDVTVKGSSSANCSAASNDNLCMSVKRYNGILGMMKTEDAKGGVTKLWYDGAGRPIAIADAIASATNNPDRVLAAKYNELGHRVQIHDPNMKADSTFAYNPFGELKKQTDARGLVTEVKARDSLGRVLTQRSINPTSVTGPGRQTFQDEWRYDSSGRLTTNWRCIGAIGDIQVDHCVQTGNEKWRQEFTYDDASRPITVTTKNRMFVDGTGQVLADVIENLYDANYGRLKAIKYPSSLRVQNIYTRYGELRDVLDADTGERFWAIETKDIWGNAKQQRFGNGVVGTYQFDPSTGQARERRWVRGDEAHTELDRIGYIYDTLGNLSSQQRVSGGQVAATATETYTYDKLQRLITATPTTSAAVTYGYDALGNFTFKSDYSTDVPGAYNYTDTVPASNCGPNVPKSVARSTGMVGNRCDSGGNITQTTEVNGVVRSTHFDATNRPLQIARAGGATASFTYAPDGTRVSELLTNSSGTALIARGPSGFEREAPVSSPGAYTLRHELGDVVVNMTQQSGGSSGALSYTVNYRMQDRLGSPLGMLNRNGVVTQALAFDSFGQAKNSNFTPRNSVPIPGETQLPMTHLGFTGHEHLKDLGVIHMNGRAYDYQLGRFMSVDPFIQFPANSQSLNPYSYILNNPFSGTDPSGYLNCSEPGGDGCKKLESARQVYTSNAYHGMAIVGGGPNGNGHTKDPLAPSQREVDRATIGALSQRSNLGFNVNDVATIPTLFGTVSATANYYRVVPDITRVFLRAFAADLAATLAAEAPMLLLRSSPLMVLFIPGDTPHTQQSSGTNNPSDIRQATHPMSGMAISTPAPGGDPDGDDDPLKPLHIVLGLRAFGLESTAARVGGQTLLNDPSWKTTFLQALRNPNAQITVSVEGLSGSSTYSKVMGAVQQGVGRAATPTNWEMAQLHQAGRLGQVRFVDSLGKVLENPFK